MLHPRRQARCYVGNRAIASIKRRKQKPGTLRRASCLAIKLSVVALGVEGVRGSRNASSDEQGNRYCYDNLHGCFSELGRGADNAMSLFIGRAKLSHDFSSSTGVTPLHRHLSRVDTWVRRRLIPSLRIVILRLNAGAFRRVRDFCDVSWHASGRATDTGRSIRCCERAILAVYARMETRELAWMMLATEASQ
jgi:hypothetical protein